MKKNISIYLIVLGLILSLAACNPCRKVLKHPECFLADTISLLEKEIVKDSIIIIEPDEAFIELFLQCDSAHNVLITELYEEKNRPNIIETKIVYRDNKLKIKAYTDSIKLLNKVIKSIKIEKEYIKNPLNQGLKKENEKLKKKVSQRKWLIYWFIITILSIVLLLFFKFKK